MGSCCCELLGFDVGSNNGVGTLGVGEWKPGDEAGLAVLEIGPNLQVKSASTPHGASAAVTEAVNGFRL